MTFQSPELLLDLLLIPIAIGFYLWSQRRRNRYAVRFTNLDLLANIAPRRPSWRRHLPPVLYLLAMAGLLMALGRPTMTLPTPREDATVILTMDVSGSMAATDVAPTRLDAARTAALAFLDQLPTGIRVGLVAFASESQVLVAPTADRAIVREALARLRPRDGTAMGDALMQMLDVAEGVQASTPPDSPPPSASPGTSAGASSDPGASSDAGAPSASPDPSTADAGPPLVASILLSDGANSAGEVEPPTAAARAAELGVPVYTIALGTPAGTVRVRDPMTGRVGTLAVPPDTATLEAIAETTGAAAFEAPTAEDLASVYQDLQSRIGFVQTEQEATVYFSAAALAFVIAGAGLAAVWFGRFP